MGTEVSKWYWELLLEAFLGLKSTVYKYLKSIKNNKVLLLLTVQSDNQDSKFRGKKKMDNGVCYATNIKQSYKYNGTEGDYLEII